MVKRLVLQAFTATVLAIFASGNAPAWCKTFSGTIENSSRSIDEQCFEPGEIKTEKQLLKGTAEPRDSLVELNQSYANQSYQDGMAAIKNKNFALAANLFKLTAARLGKGNEKLRAECLYFEAGCRLMQNERAEAANLYKSAWNLFEKYDPGSPYKELAIEQLCDLSCSRIKEEKHIKLEGLATHRAQILIDQNITLEGHASNSYVALTANILNDKKFVANCVHKCFLQMTCLETAELASNSTNARFRWLPLLAYGTPAAFALSPGDAYPFIKLKVNGRFYIVKVDLPDLNNGVRKILLVTNKEKVCAIDQDSYESWLLQMNKESDGRVYSFNWKKLLHKKT